MLPSECTSLDLKERRLGRSPNGQEVHSDGSITFRYKDPAAGKVLLNLEGAASRCDAERQRRSLDHSHASAAPEILRIWI